MNPLGGANLRERILACLREQTGPVESAVVARAVGEAPLTVLHALHELTEEGLLHRFGGADQGPVYRFLLRLRPREP